MAKNFKPGQKVVFKTSHLKGGWGVDPWHIFPKENEVVTIMNQARLRPWMYIIKEYPLSTKGTLQGINEMVLFPVDEISKQETEKITESIETFFKKSVPCKV